MIVSPDKGVFFVATALMCSASLYGAELSSAGANDPLSTRGFPMTRVFVGQPNFLTVPPGVPAVASDDEAGCGPGSAEPRFAVAAPQMAAAETDKDNCTTRGPKPAGDGIALRTSLGAANAKADLPLQPTSVASTRPAD